MVWTGTKRHKSGCWPKMVWHLLLLQTLPSQARIIPLIISATGRPSIKTGLACVKPSKLLLLHQNKGECFRPRLKSGRHEKLGQICEGCRCCLGFAGDFCSNHSDFARSSRTLGGRAVSPFYIIVMACHESSMAMHVKISQTFFTVQRKQLNITKHQNVI